MSLEKAKSTAAAIGLFLFIAGLFLMIISEHVDFVFGVGLLFFCTSIAMGMISMIWSFAGTADRVLGRYLNGDSK